MVQNGDPNLTVLGELSRKKGGKELRREREYEGERIKESSEKMRQSAPRNRGSERDRVTKRGNDVQRETERWKSVADGITPARQLDAQALLSFRCTHLRSFYGSSHGAVRAGVVA